MICVSFWAKIKTRPPYWDCEPSSDQARQWRHTLHFAMCTVQPQAATCRHSCHSGHSQNASFHKKVMVLSRAPPQLVRMRGRSVLKPKPWTKKKKRTKKEIDHLLVFSQLFQNLHLIPYSLGGRRLVPFRAPALFQVVLVVLRWGVWNFAIE